MDRRAGQARGGGGRSPGRDGADGRSGGRRRRQGAGRGLRRSAGCRRGLLGEQPWRHRDAGRRLRSPGHVAGSFPIRPAYWLRPAAGRLQIGGRPRRAGRTEQPVRHGTFGQLLPPARHDLLPGPTGGQSCPHSAIRRPEAAGGSLLQFLRRVGGALLHRSWRIAEAAPNHRHALHPGNSLVQPPYSTESPRR